MPCKKWSDYKGSAVTILRVSFEEIQLLGQIAAGHKLHIGPKRPIRDIRQFGLN